MYNKTDHIFSLKQIKKDIVMAIFKVYLLYVV